ncbi:uncharacterized protein LOC144442052 [Glandiceps talaboti]
MLPEVQKNIERDKKTCTIQTLLIFILACLILCIAFMTWSVFRSVDQSYTDVEFEELHAEMLLLKEQIQALVQENEEKSSTNHLMKRRQTRTSNSRSPNCSSGRDGRDGLQGSPGSQGVQGPRGEIGNPGAPGVNGISGSPGDSSCRGSNDDESQGSSSDHNHGTTGSVYIRWGRDDCAGTAELVYKGFIGGAHYTHSGSGSNYQCLPESPIYDAPVSGSQSSESGLLYGGEYQTNLFPKFASLYQHDPVCAVCRVRTRGSVLMVPARNVCPSNEWTREYYGYLMSEKHSHKRTEYICVDRNPEARSGSVSNDNGALLFPVEGRCGTLPCGPYINYYELTCAVCTI